MQNSIFLVNIKIFKEAKTLEKKANLSVGPSLSLDVVPNNCKGLWKFSVQRMSECFTN